MTAEKIPPINQEQERLQTLTQLQEVTGTNIIEFINGFIGDMYLFGRRIKIVSSPSDFTLTLYRDDNSQTIFEANKLENDYNSTGIKSKFTLSRLEQSGTKTALTTYRFNQEQSFKSYLNGKPKAETSKMTASDITNAAELLGTINAYFKKSD